MCEWGSGIVGVMQMEGLGRKFFNLLIDTKIDLSSACHIVASTP